MATEHRAFGMMLQGTKPAIGSHMATPGSTMLRQRQRVAQLMVPNLKLNFSNAI